MNIFLIAKSNIRKSKSSVVALFFLIVLATMLLYIGANVLLQLGDFIDDKSEELNGAHYAVISNTSYNDNIEDTLKSIEGYQYGEYENLIYYLSPQILNTRIVQSEQTMSMMIFNAENQRTISNLVILEAVEERKENSIVLPYVLKSANGYRVGDEVIITNSNIARSYTVYGFYEDVIFANPVNIMCYKCFIFDDSFQQLYDEVDESSKSIIHTVRLDYADSSEAYQAAFDNKIKENISDPNFYYQGLCYATFSQGSTVFVNLLMVILVAFSMILLCIALIVIRFAIVTHIESNMANIGVMEAAGYTTTQMIKAVIMEFLMIAVSGWTVGILISFLTSSFITNFVSSSIGLRWRSEINMVAMLASLAIVLSLISLITYITARNIKNITPLNALRNGIVTHNFKKNHLPLEKTALNVNLVIGLKDLFHNKKQNRIIFMIAVIFSFACIFAFTCYYNFVKDNGALLKIIGIETADVLFTISADQSEEVFAEIEKAEEVDKIGRLTSFDTTLFYNEKEEIVNLNICEDYSKLNINTVVIGRRPLHDNEISVTKLVLNKLGAGIGDNISITYNNVTEEYLVVGVSQQISMLGRSASITEEGMKRLVSGYKINSLMIYLEEEQDITEFIQNMEEKYKGMNAHVVNYKESIRTLLLSFTSAITILCIACVIITVLTISLILFLLIKVKILKEQKQIGISKALGYTTIQLISHVVVSFLPIVFLGSIVGSIISIFLVNPSLELLLTRIGIIECGFYISKAYIFLVPVGISILAYITLIFVASRIRKIAPYELFAGE